MGRIDAPWTQEQVDALNRYQTSGVFHPFTCAKAHIDHVSLVATTEGWVCPGPLCDYTQTWAHEFMAEEWEGYD